MTALEPRVAVTPAALPALGGRPRRSPQWLLAQLPVAMLDGDFFVRFVSIFQEVGGSLLEDADNIDHLVDVSVTPEPLLRWLGSWIGTEAIDVSLDEQMQRRIVAGAASTLSHRGTAHGLRRFLELISGHPARVEDGGGIWRDGEAPADTAWVRMTVESTGWLPEQDFVDLVRDEVPAHVYAELYVGARRIWPAQEDTR